MTNATDGHQNLDTLLEAGRKAPLIEYTALLRKVTAGETLSMTERKSFEYLQRTLEAERPTLLAASEKAPRSAQSGRAFSTKLAVAQYVESAGYKVKKSTVYNHINAGKLKPRRNGTFAIEDVDRYAAANLQRLDGTPSATGSSPPAPSPEEIEDRELKRREQRAITELAELKLADRRRDLITAPLETELAARLLILRSDIENFIHSRVSALIAAANGDQARAPEVVDFFLSATGKWLERYARGREFMIDIAGNVSPAFDESYTSEQPNAEPEDPEAAADQEAET